MARTVLDDATWASLLLIVQRIPHVWKKNEARLRLFVEAVLWVDRTGAPWRDLPCEFGAWPSIFHRFRRWSQRGWWEILFEAGRPSVPLDGFVAADSTTCKAQRAATGAARSTEAQEALGRSRGGLCSKIHACVDGAGRLCVSLRAPASTPTCATRRLCWPTSPRPTWRWTEAMSAPGSVTPWHWTDALSTPRRRKT